MLNFAARDATEVQTFRAIVFDRVVVSLVVNSRFPFFVPRHAANYPAESHCFW